MSSYEMRVYQVAPGKFADLHAVMREVMVPLMREYRMEALSFFATADEAAIHWFVRHDGDKGIDADWDRFHADPRWTDAMAARTQGTSFIAGETSTPMQGMAGLPPMLEADNLATVGAYAEGLFGRRDPSVVDRHVTPDMVNHNPEAPPGPEGVKGFIQHFFGQFPNASARAVRMAAQGDLVFVHSLLKTGPEDRGTVVADVFRIADGRIAEHWDVTQPIPERTIGGEPVV